MGAGERQMQLRNQSNDLEIANRRGGKGEFPFYYVPDISDLLFRRSYLFSLGSNLLKKFAVLYFS